MNTRLEGLWAEDDGWLEPGAGASPGRLLSRCATTRRRASSRTCLDVARRFGLGADTGGASSIPSIYRKLPKIPSHGQSINDPNTKFTKKSHPGRGTSNDAAVQGA
eukprot:scaffold20179_cov103-Isochrysis_galbana.AAC.4